MQSYNFSNNSNLVAAERTATALLQSYFSSVHCFISMPTFSVTPDRVVVQLFYYVSAPINGGRQKVNTTAFGNSALSALGSAISRLFSAASVNWSHHVSNNGLGQLPVELRIVRLHQPYLNSYILAQYLAVNASKYGFARLRQSLFSSIRLITASNLASLSKGVVTNGPNTSSIIGVKVQLSGLLTTQRNAPRKTVSTVSVGTFHGDNTTVDYASSTSKSNLGAYTVKVWLCTLTKQS